MSMFSWIWKAYEFIDGIYLFVCTKLEYVGSNLFKLIPADQWDPSPHHAPHLQINPTSHAPHLRERERAFGMLWVRERGDMEWRFAEGYRGWEYKCTLLGDDFAKGCRKGFKRGVWNLAGVSSMLF